MCTVVGATEDILRLSKRLSDETGASAPLVSSKASSMLVLALHVGRVTDSIRMRCMADWGDALLSVSEVYNAVISVSRPRSREGLLACWNRQAGRNLPDALVRPRRAGRGSALCARREAAAVRERSSFEQTDNSGSEASDSVDDRLLDLLVAESSENTTEAASISCGAWIVAGVGSKRRRSRSAPGLTTGVGCSEGDGMAWGVTPASIASGGFADRSLSRKGRSSSSGGIVHLLAGLGAFLSTKASHAGRRRSRRLGGGGAVAGSC